MMTAAPPMSDIERVRRFYDRAAADYDRGIQLFDRLLLGDGRKRLCSFARGDTLELAIGTGLNIAFYPPDVRLTGIDVSPGMLSVARARADKELGVRAELRLGDAQDIDFPDGSFDTVLCTLSLCTIPDETRALAEAYRVLRSGGTLLLLEHVRSPVAPVRWLERVLDPLARLSGGDHLLRDPLDHLTATGFQLVYCARSKWGIVEEVVARKSEAEV
jgi:ubiquinone/menaquinone biosynthesis C-methylase UbiE